MNLILFGFKSCGKTTLGKMIGHKMGRPFIDTDRIVEELYRNRNGQNLSYREIFKLLGKEGFCSLESDAVQQLKGLQDVIIALGGGLILNPGNAADLAKLGQLVYLNVSKGTLKQRILSRELPAYLDPLDPEGSFERMYEERLPQYEKIFALSIDLEIKTQDQVVQEICALIKKKESKNG